jgi:putative Holliday junction resolvase
MTNFSFKNLAEIKIEELRISESTVLGLDIGDKTIGIATSDREIKIASGVTTIFRNRTERDFKLLKKSIENYRIGLVILGWPLQMNGLAGSQCEKVLEFAQNLSSFIPGDLAKWDERFSTKVVDNLMIQADLSRRKRKKIVDQSAAVYLLQGALDFLNHSFVK